MHIIGPVFLSKKSLDGALAGRTALEAAQCNPDTPVTPMAWHQPKRGWEDEIDAQDHHRKVSHP